MKSETHVIFTKWPENKDQPPAPFCSVLPPSEKDIQSVDVSAKSDDPPTDQPQQTTSDPTILQATYSVPTSSSDTVTQSAAHTPQQAVDQAGSVEQGAQAGSGREATVEGQATEEADSKTGVLSEERKEVERGPASGDKDAPLGVAKEETTPLREKSIRQAWDEKQSFVQSPHESPAVKSAEEYGEDLAVEDIELNSDPQQGPEASILEPPDLPPQVRGTQKLCLLVICVLSAGSQYSRA